MEQGVVDIEEVPDAEAFRPHLGFAVLKVDSHAVTAKRVGPEQAARVGMDPWVEVVDLGGEVCEVELTSVEVESNKPECPPVNGAILADVNAFHKTHIGVEQKRLNSAVRIPGGPCSLHFCDADLAIEIGDR